MGRFKKNKSRNKELLRNLHWRKTPKMKPSEEGSGPTSTSHHPLQEGMAPSPEICHNASETHRWDTYFLLAPLPVSKEYFRLQRGCEMPLDPSRLPARCLYAVMVLPSASSLLMQENLQWKQWESLNCLRSNLYKQCSAMPTATANTDSPTARFPRFSTVSTAKESLQESGLYAGRGRRHQSYRFQDESTKPCRPLPRT